MNHKTSLSITPIVASILLAIAVMVGAFGAHGLEGKVSEMALKTYQTGVTYHFYHALAILIIGLFELQTKIRFKVPTTFFLLGILLFSSNCYFYALTEVRAFAMVVPLGGLSFIVGWLSLTYSLYKLRCSGFDKKEEI